MPTGATGRDHPQRRRDGASHRGKRHTRRAGQLLERA